LVRRVVGVEGAVLVSASQTELGPHVQECGASSVVLRPRLIGGHRT
jgi:hypothetical protein